MPPDALSTESRSHELAVAFEIGRPVEFFFCDDLMLTVEDCPAEGETRCGQI
jgi:hypothetical protein